MDSRVWWRARWLRSTRQRRSVLAAEVVVIALIGCWLGLLAGGHLSAAVGPLQTRLGVDPALRGGSTVEIPPLGELHVRTHAGPRLTVEVTRINAADARRIFGDPAAVQGLGTAVAHDLRGAVITVAVKAAVAAVAGALLLGVLVFRRRWRLALWSGAVATAVVLVGAGVAAATWNPRAIDQPEYDGLLASAPGVVGDARSIVSNFGKYEDELGRLVTNVSRLYDVTSTLPAYQPNPSTIRVLSVSDLHLNPAAWDVIRSVSKQFQVDVIVDSGDLTDHGSVPENTYVDQISTLGVPYVWVRGNHDSLITQDAVARQRNAVVLDGTKPTVVAGLRFLGVGDPRFTPDKNTRGGPAPASVAQVGLAMADAMRAQVEGEKVDVAVVHDGAAARQMDGTVPLVLSGHYHHRETNALPGGTLSFWQGSTGASGLRGVEREKPTPIELSVLYFDRDTRALQAWDDITLGGLGLVSAKIERRIFGQQYPELVPTFGGTPTSDAPDFSTLTPTPSGSASPSLTPSTSTSGP